MKVSEIQQHLDHMNRINEDLLKSMGNSPYSPSQVTLYQYVGCLPQGCIDDPQNLPWNKYSL